MCVSKADVIKVTGMKLMTELFILAVLGFFLKGIEEVALEDSNYILFFT